MVRSHAERMVFKWKNKDQERSSVCTAIQRAEKEAKEYKVHKGTQPTVSDRSFVNASVFVCRCIRIQVQILTKKLNR